MPRRPLFSRLCLAVILAAPALVAQPASSRAPASAPAAAPTPAAASAAAAVSPSAAAAVSPSTAAPAAAPDEVEPATDADSAGMPPGHPAVGGGRAASSTPDAGLAPGTVNIQVLDEDRQPLEGLRVLLETTTQSVIEGKSQSTRAATSGRGGGLRFEGVDTASTHTYRVVAERGPGRFASPPFQLRADRGEQVVVQTFPTSTDLSEVDAATALLVYVVPQTEAFRFELLLEVDLGARRAWKASQKVLGLPAHAKTFTTEEEHGESRLVANGREVRLEGTLLPGRQRLSARFDVPSSTHALLPFAQASRSTFAFDTPPQLARLTIAAEPPPGVELSSPELPAAVRDRSPNGSSVLVLSWDAGHEKPAPSRVEFTLAGLPTRGSLTSLALFAALALLGIGLFTLFGRGEDPAFPARQKQLANAVMSELVLLEQARQKGLVGPEAHSRLKRRFLALYARLSPASRGRKRSRE